MKIMRRKNLIEIIRTQAKLETYHVILLIFHKLERGGDNLVSENNLKRNRMLK